MLKDAALMLDDIMDECGCEVLGMEYQSLMGVSNKVQKSLVYPLFIPNMLFFVTKLSRK